MISSTLVSIIFGFTATSIFDEMNKEIISY